MAQIFVVIVEMKGFVLYIGFFYIVLSLFRGI